MAKQKSLGRQALDLLLEMYPLHSRERTVVRRLHLKITFAYGRLSPRQRKKRGWTSIRDEVLFDTTDMNDEFRNQLEDYWSAMRVLAGKLNGDHEKVGTGLMSAYRHMVAPWATGRRKLIPGSPAKSRQEKRQEHGQQELPF